MLKRFAMLAMLLTALTGCTGMNHTGQRVASGAAIGAAVGATGGLLVDAMQDD